MGHTIKNNLLRGSNGASVVHYLKQLLRERSEDEITKHLFTSVKTESLPPYIISIWLSLTKSTAALHEALLQEFSVAVRRTAIKQFAKALRRQGWREAWTAVGGVSGLVSLLARFSLAEVKRFINHVGRSIKGPNVDEQRKVITELLTGLLSGDNPDGRHLREQYLYLVPSCTEAFVRHEIYDRSSDPTRANSWGLPTLLRDRYSWQQQLCLDRVLQKKVDLLGVPGFRSLLRSVPPTPSKEPRFSESMCFACNILRTVVKADGPDPTNGRFLPEIVDPLIWRAVRRKVPLERLGEIITLAVSYLKRNPDSAGGLELCKGNLTYHVMRLWSKKAPSFENEVVSILGLLSKRLGDNTAASYQTASGWVDVSLRYKLLRFFFLHARGAGHGIDIEDVGSLDQKVNRLPLWRHDLFLSMDRDNALGLLTRLRQANPEDDFLAGGGGLFNVNARPGSFHGDPYLLMYYIESRETPDADRAAQIVDDRKAKAMRSREQQDRALFAKSALFFSIASRSLELYDQTLQWARRFVRDPITAKSIYSANAVLTFEGLRLLSGIPFKLSKDSSLSEIKHRVTHGNKIIREVFETACSAMREPSFAAADWNCSFTLLGHVMGARLDGSESLREELKLENNEIYEILWSDTLGLATRIEEAVLQPGFEKLGLNQPGVLWRNFYQQASRAGSPADYTFIDNLAKARDQLWKKYRLSQDPNVVSIPSALPRGLPLQFLMADLFRAYEFGVDMTPFISSRAHAVVFPDPHQIMAPIPDDQGVRSAIGPYVDSYEVALQLYIRQGQTEKSKQERAMSAWSHALNRLSSRYKDEREASHNWVALFSRAFREFKWPDYGTTDCGVYPILPSDVDPDENTEWNPEDEYKPPPKIDSRKLPATLLDCQLEAIAFPSHSGIEFAVPKAQTLPFSPPGFYPWDTRKARYTHRSEVRDGQIISAMLYLDSKKRGKSRILSSPFPSKFDVRYPSLFLDEGFLLRKDLSISAALASIESHIGWVPPSLLFQLASTALAAASNLPPEDSERAEMENMAYKLVRLLILCDKPRLAIPLAFNVVFEHPEASSWHRQLLSRKLLVKLPSGHTEELVKSFADAVMSKMQEAARKKQVSPSEVSPSGAANSPSTSKAFVKVTTVKYLAEILEGEDYLPTEFIGELLPRILRGAFHPDIRVAVVESMLKMLHNHANDDSEDRMEHLVTGLKSTMPFITALNERMPIQETDWTNAESKGDLPEVSEDGGIANLPPILGLLVTYSSFVTDRLVDRILLPALDGSVSNNTRWTRLFAAKKGLSLEFTALPAVPVKPKLLIELLKSHFREVPGRILDQYQQFVLVNLKPPAAMSELNRALKTDPAERSLNSTKHWLSLFNCENAWNFQGYSLASRLTNTWINSARPDGITREKFEQYILEQAQALLETATVSTSQFDSFMNGLIPPVLYEKYDWRGRVSHNTMDLWATNSMPLVERIIALIESMRTPEWRRNPERQPPILPSTFKYRLWLLPFPPASPSQSTPMSDRCKPFAEALTKTIRGLNDGEPYADRMAELRSISLRCHIDFYAYIGVQLGTLKPKMALEDFLRIDLAESFLKMATPSKDIDVARAVMAVLESWRTCGIETIWMKAFSMSNTPEFINKGWAKLD